MGGARKRRTAQRHDIYARLDLAKPLKVAPPRGRVAQQPVAPPDRLGRLQMRVGHAVLIGSRLDLFHQILVRGGDHPHVHPDRLLAPHPLELTLLEDPQQLDLDGRGDVADLVEEDGAAVGQLEPADAIAVCAGEGTSDVAERRRMVERQIERRDVKDPNVLKAMRTVPRHAFMPARQRAYAYADTPLIKVREDESLENALKRFKQKCEKSGILTEIKKRQHYEKPSVRKKRKALAARKKLLKRLAQERRLNG